MARYKARTLYRICPMCNGKPMVKIGINSSYQCTLCKKVRVVAFELNCDQIDDIIHRGKFNQTEVLKLMGKMEKIASIADKTLKESHFQVWHDAMKEIAFLTAEFKRPAV